MFNSVVTDVFFDLDHTLWDFEKNSRLTFLKIFESNGIDQDIDDFLTIYVPLNLQYWKLYREERITKKALRYERLKKAFDAVDYEVDDPMINLLSEQYIEHLSSFNHLIPNAVEILDYLKPKYRLHIITNGFQEIQEKKLKKSNILNYFDQVVNSEMAGVKKPDPGIFKLALKMANTKADQSMMIGDNIEADILGARAVGLNTLHFNVHNEPIHDYAKIIHDLGEIKSYL
ncbi:MAG: YjjG family noncanonical pyrimidine nucleotidase [Flavobacteriaceae bacterium]